MTSFKHDLINFYKDLSSDLISIKRSLGGQSIRKMAEDIKSLDKKRDEKNLNRLIDDASELIKNFGIIRKSYRSKYKAILRKHKKFIKDADKLANEDKELADVIIEAKDAYEKLIKYADDDVFKNKLFYKVTTLIFDEVELIVDMSFEDFLFK